MFFGRENELREIVEQVDSASFALIGGRRVGKTSILQRLNQIRLPAAEMRPFYFSCQRVSEQHPVQEFLATIAAEWLNQTTSVPVSFASLLTTLPHNKPLVFLLDEADRLIPADRKAGWPLFGELRALAHEKRCQFVFAGERVLRDAILTDSTSPLFNFAKTKRIGCLTEHAVKELVCRPMQQLDITLTDDAAIVRRVMDFTAGHPNVVQRLCQRLIERLTRERKRQITLADIDAVLADPAFQYEDFLLVFWEQATVLERMISLALAGHTDHGHSIQEVREILRTELGVDAKAQEVDAALRRLVELRSLLAHTPQGYEFAIRAFPAVIGQTGTAKDLLEVLSEEYHASGDVVVN